MAESQAQEPDAQERLACLPFISDSRDLRPEPSHRCVRVQTNIEYCTSPVAHMVQ